MFLESLFEFNALVIHSLGDGQCKLMIFNRSCKAASVKLWVIVNDIINNKLSPSDMVPPAYKGISFMSISGSGTTGMSVSGVVCSGCSMISVMSSP